MTDSPPLHPLLPHAAVTAPGKLNLAAGYAWLTADGLRLSYRLQGDIADLRIPAPQQPEQAEIGRASCRERV